jgi:hypothetical protein
MSSVEEKLARSLTAESTELIPFLPMLNISGIPIEVCKKDIKNMHLYVKSPNGNVVRQQKFAGVNWR